MSTPLRDAFRDQAASCQDLGSAFMYQLMNMLAERLDTGTAVGRRCLAWEGRVDASGQSVPLRLAGVLHSLVLSGRDRGLAGVYPPANVEDSTLWEAVEGALVRHEDHIMAWLDNAPQTNEVRRAAAIIAGIWWALGRTNIRDVTLSELGASGGLNLGLDRFTVRMDDRDYGPENAVLQLMPSWRGNGRPDARRFEVVDKSGVDLAPIDASTDAGRLRLLAYVWADQTDRIERTRAAFDAGAPTPAKGDAAPWLQKRLAHLPVKALNVVYTTIAAQYFPQATRADIDRYLASAGAKAGPHTPLLHLALEGDGQSPGAALTARLWLGGAPVQKQLARVDFHGRWIEWVGHDGLG